MAITFAPHRPASVNSRSKAYIGFKSRIFLAHPNVFRCELESGQQSDVEAALFMRPLIKDFQLRLMTTPFPFDNTIPSSMSFTVYRAERLCQCWLHRPRERLSGPGVMALPPDRRVCT